MNQKQQLRNLGNTIPATERVNFNSFGVWGTPYRFTTTGTVPADTLLFDRGFTAHEAREILRDMGIPHGVWVEENEIHGGGGESHDGNGDDGKKKKEDKSKQAKDAVNYTNGVATLIGGAAENAKLCSIVNKSCSALSIGGIIYNIYYDYTSFDKREISFYSFCARTNNSIGEYALTRIPYGIGVPVSVIVTAVDICGGFDNNIYNEEWVKSVLKRALDGIRDCIQPNNRQFYEESINVYYKYGM